MFAGQTDVSAIAYAPTDADNTFWIGDASGRLFRTKDGGATWRSLAVPAMAGLTITEVAVHPRNASIVAVTLGGAGVTDPQVFVSHDEGATWKDVSERTAADRRLPP